MRRCALLLTTALVCVLRSEQYGFWYYAGWCLVYLSCFLMCPSVLPTDNTKIAKAGMFLIYKLSFGAIVAMIMTKRKYDYYFAQCETKWLCAWNVVFWGAHSLMACVHGLFLLVANTRQEKPETALHYYWYTFGCHFTFIGAVGIIDLFFDKTLGTLDAKSLVGKGAVILVQFLIGRLCHSNTFKLKMWRYAASHASISMRQETTPTHNNKRFFFAKLFSRQSSVGIKNRKTLSQQQLTTTKNPQPQ